MRMVLRYFDDGTSPKQGLRFSKGPVPRYHLVMVMVAFGIDRHAQRHGLDQSNFLDFRAFGVPDVCGGK